MWGDNFSQYLTPQAGEILRYLSQFSINLLGPNIFPYDQVVMRNPESTQITPLHPPIREKTKNNKKQRSPEQAHNVRKLQCGNKYCDKSTEECTQLRVGERQMTFCVLCYQNYKDNCFCEYCIQVFDPMDEDEIDDKEWIQCEDCERWVRFKFIQKKNHIECEQQHGIENIKKIKRNTNYYCRACRSKSPDLRIQRLILPPKKDPLPTLREHSQLPSQKVQAVQIKLSDAEILQDLEDLRLLVLDNPTQFRKTSRRKRQRID